MNIDWSKAPEGATHYYKNSPQPWRDLSGYNWKYFSSGEWHSGPSVCTSDELMREIGKVLFAKPLTQPWAGEGLPPVGAVCECNLPGELTNNYSWVEARVIWHNGPTECAVVRSSSKLAWCDEFRPIRTPEKIAADERQAAIKEMIGHIGGSRRCEAEVLYDAGYRKQVQP